VTTEALVNFNHALLPFEVTAVWSVDINRSLVWPIHLLIECMSFLLYLQQGVMYQYMNKEIHLRLSILDMYWLRPITVKLACDVHVIHQI
jgi:hypothetical protein